MEKCSLNTVQPFRPEFEFWTTALCMTENFTRETDNHFVKRPFKSTDASMGKHGGSKASKQDRSRKPATAGGGGGSKREGAAAAEPEKSEPSVPKCGSALEPGSDSGVVGRLESRLRRVKVVSLLLLLMLIAALVFFWYKKEVGLGQILYH
jgi:hypothetical protein